MLDFLLSDLNILFVISLYVVVAAAFMEVIGLIFGASIGGLIDDLIPDFDAPDVDAPDSSLSVGGIGGSFANVLSWLNIGKLPVLVVLILFCASFGIIGLTIQAVLLQTIGEMMPAPIAAAPAALLALTPVRYVGRALAKVMPREETYADSRAAFVGRVATVVRGVARAGKPAEAKFIGPHGRTHYVLVEPSSSNETFEAGSRVRLTRLRTASFEAVKADE